MLSRESMGGTLREREGKAEGNPSSQLEKQGKRRRKFMEKKERKIGKLRKGKERKVRSRIDKEQKEREMEAEEKVVLRKGE